METLSPQALAVIEKYLHLPVGCGCQTPYFNNRRKRVRGGLRALVGKGSPEEIAEEAEILAVRDRASIKNMTPETLKKFLIDENLGIDCSGFAYHVLDAESQARIGKKLRSILKQPRGSARKIVYLFRPAENSGVSIISHEKNSVEIKIEDIRPGDFISIIGTGIDRKYNHMVVVENIAKAGDSTKITYIHSYAWPEDGTYGHGVRRGTIDIKAGRNILDGVWTEKEKTGNANFTLTSARNAQTVSLRRLRTF